MEGSSASAALLLRLSDRAALQPVFPIGLSGSLFLERLAFLDTLGQALYPLHTEECRELAIWGSFIDDDLVFLVCSAFEYYMFVCLEFCATWTNDGPLFGSILRSSRVQPELVSLHLMCVG